MSEIDSMTEEVARKTMTLFFLTDTSGSMFGDKIGAVNEAMVEVVPDLKEIVNADAKIKIAVLSFSSGAEWKTQMPIDIEQFSWTDLRAEGITDFGEACKMLNEKLSKKAFMGDATGCYAPAIILLSDGCPTDDYKTSLEQLKNNNWFKQSIKIALAVGSDVDTKVLQEFTGNSEAVIPIHNKYMLKKLIRFVSVRASQIASTSSVVTSDEQTQVVDMTVKQREVIDAIQGEIDIDSDDVGSKIDDVEW